MYLKSVNINGFKSFSEITNINFTNKVNVVVGPNGSGKSNVVDAISWVLGTQSPASLRTNKMEDVIFAGTEKLPKKGFAEVNLNFCVDTEKFNGTDEISIGRKLYRDGQSEYFMNGLNCRLLDVQEFLNDIGIGKQQHTIISQGQIAEILNSKPEDHRITIEEAAGILPFKMKKDKALRRIESGEKEIKRAKDVLREIKKQLKPLKEQAEQASIHQKSINELKDLKIKLNILQYKKYKSKNKIVKENISSINKELINVTKSINNQKILKTNVNDKLGENISLGSLFKDYSNKLSNKAEKIKNIIQIGNERIDNLERADVKQKNERENNKKKILDNSNKVSSLSSQLIIKKNNLKDKSLKLEILNKELLDVVKKQSLNLEINEALIENEIKFINEYLEEMDLIYKNNSENINTLKEDKLSSENLINDHKNILDNNNIDNVTFLAIKNKIYSVLQREIENYELSNKKSLSTSESKKYILEKKNEQLDLITDKDQFKEELSIQKNNTVEEIQKYENEISALSSQIISITEKIKFLNDENENLADKVSINNKSFYIKKIDELNDFSNVTSKIYKQIKDASNLIKESGEKYENKYGDNNKNIQQIETEIENLNNTFYKLKDQKNNLLIKESEISNESLTHYSYLVNIEGLTIDQINNYDEIKQEESEILKNIESCEIIIEKIGVVNYLAKEDYDSLITRYDEIQTSIDDLLLTKKELYSHIKEIESEIIFRIESSFNSISVNFSTIFEKLFPGGVGSLQLTNKDDLLETGIEISVQPRGKKVKKLSLLSGGERSLAAIAFLFAIFKSFPSPFYILDEVEAALDDANLHRMIELLEYLKNDAQFLIVTHQQQTMHAGDILYGVTMEPGSGSRIFIKTKEDFESLVSKEVN